MDNEWNEEVCEGGCLARETKENAAKQIASMERKVKKYKEQAEYHKAMASKWKNEKLKLQRLLGEGDK